MGGGSLFLMQCGRVCCTLYILLLSWWAGVPVAWFIMAGWHTSLQSAANVATCGACLWDHQLASLPPILSSILPSPMPPSVFSRRQLLLLGQILTKTVPCPPPGTACMAACRIVEFYRCCLSVMDQSSDLGTSSALHCFYEGFIDVKCDGTTFLRAFDSSFLRDASNNRNPTQ